MNYRSGILSSHAAVKRKERNAPPGHPSSGNSSGGWILWGYDVNTFVHGVLYGVRQPGQSFGDCMNQNIKETTGGRVDPALLYSKAALGAEAIAVAVGSVRSQAGTYNGIQMSALAISSAAHRLLKLGVGATRITRVSVAGAGYGLAIAGAATFGLTVGPIMNCVQPAQ